MYIKEKYFTLIETHCVHVHSTSVWNECLDRPHAVTLCLSAGQISGGSSTLLRGAYVSPTDDLKYNQVRKPKPAQASTTALTSRVFTSFVWFQLLTAPCSLMFMGEMKKHSFSGKWVNKALTDFLIKSDPCVFMENLQSTCSCLNFLQPLPSFQIRTLTFWNSTRKWLFCQVRQEYNEVHHKHQTINSSAAVALYSVGTWCCFVARLSHCLRNTFWLW